MENMTVDRDKLVEDLKAGALELTFIKADGSVRVMRATLEESVLPPFTGISTKPANQAVVHVWDLDKSDWRSVRLDRLQQVRPVL